jgi:anaphase-promoting complex subunit 1
MENCVDRESYSLAAGLALGLVVLGQGAAPMADLRDLAIPDTLHHYMVGGHARQLAGELLLDHFSLTLFCAM